MIRLFTAILAATTLNKNMDPKPTSKFSSPPSIANVNKHKEWTHKLLDLDWVASLDPNAVEVLKAPECIPLKLQTFANDHSLKPSKEMVELQEELQMLPFAGMAGAPDEANLLCLFLEMMDAKTVVEVGVFRGITTLVLASCLQRLNCKHACKRKVIGLDVSSDFAEVGKKYWKKAGVEDLIDFRVGDAKATLSQLLEDSEYGENSVDLCFIDADKTSYDDYYEKCLRLTKSGGLIVVDNTIWSGRVLMSDSLFDFLEDRAKGLSADDKSDEARELRTAVDAKAIRDLLRKIYNDDRIERVSFLTIADGVTICRKK